MGLNNLHEGVLHAEKTHQVTATTGTTAIPLFTVTGRVLILTFTGHCTETLTAENGDETIEVGGATNTAGLLAQISVDALDADEWFLATPVGGLIAMEATQKDMLTDEDIIVTVAGTTGYDDGTVFYEVSYVPLTSGATLVAA